MSTFQSARLNYQCLIARNKKIISVTLLQFPLDIHKISSDLGHITGLQCQVNIN